EDSNHRCGRSPSVECERLMQGGYHFTVSRADPALAAALQLGTAWRVGARPGAGDRGDQAGELEGGAQLLAVESQVSAQPAVVMKPCQQRRPEGIAGPDR